MFISQLARWCSKSFKLDFRSMWNQNFQMYNLGFKKGRGTRDQVAKLHWIMEKAKEFQKKKKSISVLLIMPKPLTVWTTINYGKFWKRWEYQTTWPASWETYMPVSHKFHIIVKEPPTPLMEKLNYTVSWFKYKAMLSVNFSSWNRYLDVLMLL